MSDLRVVAIRGPAVESIHRIHASVCDAQGRTIASAGDPSCLTFWRSAAKPFQALPLVEDGVLDRYGLEDLRLIYWGFGAHMGRGMAQTPRGDLLVDVRDTGGDIHKDVTARAYHTRQRLSFHNDQGDVVGLLCYRHAKAGGKSLIVSSAGIHNEILATRPDLLRLLLAAIVITIALTMAYGLGIQPSEVYTVVPL